MKLLYAEDERDMAEAVCDVLEMNGYLIDVVYDGDDALECALDSQYDGIILDIMMPKRSGLDVLKTIRAKGIKTPVLLLTAKSEVEDRIKGLDLGADDYLAKPFSMGELLARIRALLRRRDVYTPSLMTFKDLELDILSYEIKTKEKSLKLTKIEYQLMELLLL